LTIGTVILAIVLFSPGGLLGAVDAWRRARAGKKSRLAADMATGEEETGA